MPVYKAVSPKQVIPDVMQKTCSHCGKGKSVCTLRQISNILVIYLENVIRSTDSCFRVWLLSLRAVWRLRTRPNGLCSEKLRHAWTCIVMQGP